MILSEDNDQEQLLDDSTCSEQSFHLAVQLDHPMVSSTPVVTRCLDLSLCSISPPSFLPVSLAMEEEEQKDIVSPIQLGLISGSSPKQWYGFKIVGDNIDKSVKPQHETIDHHRNSLHYFHSYAVLDRIDLTKFSEVPLRLAIDSFPITSLLPSLEETKQVADNFGVLVGRVLVEYLPHLSSLSDVCVKHIEHR